MTTKAKKDNETYIKLGERANEPKMLCQGCGFEQVIRCPLPIDQFCDIVNGFQRRHAECRGKSA
ncbi:MAG: hypothetical protein ACRD1Z_21045 [Vicinamibacteria bacterium]